MQIPSWSQANEFAGALAEIRISGVNNEGTYELPLVPSDCHSGVTTVGQETVTPAFQDCKSNSLPEPSLQQESTYKLAAGNNRELIAF